MDADRAINFLTLAVSVALFYLLLGVERNHVPFAWYVLTVYGLIVFYGAYLGIRLLGRYFITRHRAALAPNAVPIPTGNPSPGSFSPKRGRPTASAPPGPLPTRTRARRRTLHGRGVDRAVLASGPSPSAPQALDWSYALARQHGRMMDDTYHFGEAFERPVRRLWRQFGASLSSHRSDARWRCGSAFRWEGAAPLVRSAWYRPVNVRLKGPVVGGERSGQRDYL